MKAILTENVGMLTFDLTVDLELRMYTAYLLNLRPALHPIAQREVDRILEELNHPVQFPGYTVFTQ